jgi:hypothetical protein
MAGVISVFLSLLKVGILGCVGKEAAPLTRQLMGELAVGVFSPVFLPSGAGRSSEMISPEGLLVSSSWFLLPTRQAAI